MGLIIEKCVYCGRRVLYGEKSVYDPICSNKECKERRINNVREFTRQGY